MLVPGMIVPNKSEKTEINPIESPPRVAAIGIFFSRIFRIESVLFKPLKVKP